MWGKDVLPLSSTIPSQKYGQVTSAHDASAFSPSSAHTCPTTSMVVSRQVSNVVDKRLPNSTPVKLVVPALATLAGTAQNSVKQKTCTSFACHQTHSIRRERKKSPVDLIDNSRARCHGDKWWLQETTSAPPLPGLLRAKRLQKQIKDPFGW